MRFDWPRIVALAVRLLSVGRLQAGVGHQVGLGLYRQVRIVAASPSTGYNRLDDWKRAANTPQAAAFAHLRKKSERARIAASVSKTKRARRQ